MLSVFPRFESHLLSVSDELIESIRAKQPEMSLEKKKRYKEEFDIPEYDINIITNSKHLADLFEETVELGAQPKKVSNWIMGETLMLLKEKEMDPEDISFSASHLADLIKMTDAKEINSTVAKEVFEKIFFEDVDPKAYVEEKGLKTENNEYLLFEVAKRVIEANPQSVTDYKSGKEKAIGFLVGQSMRELKGKADSVAVTEMLKKLMI